MKMDVFLVGVGGQGILTIGSLLSEAAQQKSMPVNFFPSKGMAQRGGLVTAQLRLGRTLSGPNIPEQQADLVIAIEVSEALKAVRMIKPGGDFILMADIWRPNDVALGRAAYPKLDIVKEKIDEAGGLLHLLMPEQLPQVGHIPVQPNLFMLGYALQYTPLGDWFSIEELEILIKNKWPNLVTENLLAYQTGLMTYKVNC
ncbi:MAG: 2-oxoacid:acceptor oxidoreductase family protein [Anaerolineaceae bacterium]|nr:2-oxoacid:acceptor oxidoreductase family protein [Anaerolineaceae bacterium]